MSRTISSSVTGPVTLNPTTDNPLTITSTGTVTATGTVASVYGTGANWTVSNSGSVSAATADGFKLSGGATLTNNAGGVITSSGTHGGGLSVGAGIYIQNGSGNVTNNGSISGGGYGVALGGGGSVTNTSSITGGEDAVRISGGAGTISNSGTLAGTFDDTIGLFSGGSITNASGATITSSGTAGAAIYASSGGATNVNNSGNISATFHGVVIEGGGTVTNNAGATITGQNTGVFFKNVAGTVDNSGNISGTGTNGTGVYLMNNGSITNTSTGTISGLFFGAFLEGGAGTISNSGSISGATYDGIVLGLGGTVTNLAGGHISGGSTGVYVKYRAAGTVTNSGSISETGTSSTGVDLAGGGTLTNNAGGSITGGANGVFVGSSSTLATISMIGTISNAGNISGGKYDGIDLSKGGSVTNLSGGTITGVSNGVYVNTGASGAVTNTGNINSTGTAGAGIDLGGGGSVTNNTGGVITGAAFGVFTTGALGTVSNSGSISGSHGVDLAVGGSVTNNATGSITGQVAGVQMLVGAGTLVNTGHITATAGAGADIEGGGSVTNSAGGNITGSTIGVFMSGSANSVTNAGTLSGPTYAVDFTGSGTNRLIVDPTAVFVGKVAANSTAANTLELASGTGSIGGLGGIGSSFANFQTLAVDTGGSWTLTGANGTTSVLDAGSLDVAGTLAATSIAFQGTTSALLIDNAATFGSNVGSPSYTGPQLQHFVSGDKVDLKNISSVGATFTYNATTGLLQVTNSLHQVATLDFQNSTLGIGSLQLSSDGSAGTMVTLGSSTVSPPPPPLPAVAGADVEWQNGPGGVLAVWSMNGPQVVASNYVTVQGSVAEPSAAWSVAGLGDFNGDGTNDFLWRNQNGSMVDWTMNGSQISSLQTVTFGGSPVGPGSAWSVAGIGDFNGDGKDDILWRNTDNSLVDWTMNGSQVTSVQQVTIGGSAAAPSSSWSVAGIGDFNGDGNADVLWRNTNGSLVDWTMNGSQISSLQTVTLGGSAVAPDSSWSVVGIGDFNGDGKSDILWRNTNGTLMDWTMNGSQIASEQQVTLGGAPATPDFSWQIAQIGDFNGDGKSDILWRNTSGAMQEWEMNGAQIASSSPVTLQGSPVGPSNTWTTLAKPTDFV
ncbi:MAG: VCBS repeat-containing protein [Hyphomicrobiales bacterium]|nr:VCBS repeat-containing protein [Hyphomicrobiales bacterium]